MHAALPPPPAGEGWGERVSAGKTPQEDRTLTRRALRVGLSRKRERRVARGHTARTKLTSFCC
ncbi:hypothetical protein XH96_28685 [Bradyrhizobium sp. CCBAU 51765]|nr:hypothetical protein XH96_28685 [Bradyrhizobium sp. CCBAU 51765]